MARCGIAIAANILHSGANPHMTAEIDIPLWGGA
jgi:hypothetical protein